MSEGIRDSGNEGSKPLVSSSAGDMARVLGPNGMEAVVGEWVSEVSRGKRSPFRSECILQNASGGTKPWGMRFPELLNW